MILAVRKFAKSKYISDHSVRFLKFSLCINYAKSALSMGIGTNLPEILKLTP